MLWKSILINPHRNKYISFENKEQLLDHVAKGNHLGTELSCPRCHKRFDIDKNELRKLRFPKRTRHGEMLMPILNETAPSFRIVPAIVRLVQHMESSTTCSVMDSEKYGHYIHIYSGGFLQVQYDELNRPYIKEAEEPDPEPAVEPWDNPVGSEW